MMVDKQEVVVDGLVPEMPKGMSVELYRDSLITFIRNQQVHHVKKGTGLTDDGVSEFVNTYLWLNSIGRQESLAQVKGKMQAFSDYIEPSVVHGYLSCPKYLIMSNEQKGEFTLSQDYPYDMDKVVTASQFRDLWDDVLLGINPKNRQLQMVPVSIAGVETLDTVYPKVFHSKMLSSCLDDATKLPVILKDNVNIYSSRSLNADVSDYLEDLVSNWFHKLVHPTSGPEASHVSAKPAVSKTEDLKPKDKK